MSFLVSNHEITKLSGIENHHPNDVLKGWGRLVYTNKGNAYFRALVELNRELYASLPKPLKRTVAQQIVEAIRAQEPPGRFLTKNKKTSLWCDVGDQEAIRKTSQALRDCPLSSVERRNTLHQLVTYSPDLIELSKAQHSTYNEPSTTKQYLVSPFTISQSASSSSICITPNGSHKPKKKMKNGDKGSRLRKKNAF